MDEETKVNRQNILRAAAGMESNQGGPNPDYRSMNIAKGGGEPVQTKRDMGTMKGVAIAFDVAGAAIGAIPGPGWAISFFLVFPAGFMTMYFMANSKGVSGSEFISAFKHAYLEPIPYLNITPVFTAGAYKLSGDSLLNSAFGMIKGK